MLAVVGAFAEALRATTQPCTFLLIVPTGAAVIAGRAHWQALVAALIAAISGGWILADNEFLLEGAWLRVSAVVVVIATIVLAAPLFRARWPRTPTALDRPWVQAGIVGGIVLIATQWWRPCVGTELGAILSDAQFGLAGQLAPMAFYMLGTTVPVAGIVALRYAIGPAERIVRAASGVFASVVVVIALFLVAGRHESVTITLTRWTLR